MDAGPSSSSAGPAPAHGAFHIPQIPEYRGQRLPDLPASSDALQALIVSATTLYDVKQHLLPVLCAMEDTGGKRSKKVSSSDLLALPGIDLAATTEEQMRTHTLGFIYVLSARMARISFSNKGDLGDLLAQAFRLCEVGDPLQMALAPERVTEFAWGLLRLAQKVDQTSTALGPLRFLLHKSDSGATFNGVHAVFLEACLLTRSIPLGYDSLSASYINVREGTPYLDVLTFHHHAGTIAAAFGDFARATDLFSFAAAMPAQAASAIQIACAKRAILCELLSTGQRHQFPKDTSRAVSSILEKGVGEYTKLSKVFADRNWARVQETAQAGKDVFENDCNWGLVVHIIHSVTKHRILELRKTFSRLTLADLADKAGCQGDEGIANVRSTIEQMVARNEIRATVSGTPEIVTFVEDDSSGNMDRLARAQAKAQWSHEDLVRANRALGLNRKWLATQVRAVESGKRTDKGGARDFDASDDIGGAPPVRGVGANLSDMGF